MTALAERLIAEERVTTWMYLDTADPPVVTTGVGHALLSLENALVLPWDQPPAAVQWDYDAVRTAPPGYKAAWYAHLTKCRLAEAFVRELLERDIEAAVVTLKKYFPFFNTCPGPAREALSDMAFNLGGEFLHGWPHFRAAIEAGDWKRAAAECHRKGISEERNRATEALFEQAAQQGAVQVA